MTFSDNERAALLALKGAGPTVITRLKQPGFTSFEQLRDARMEDIVAQAFALEDPPAGRTVLRRKPPSTIF